MIAADPPWEYDRDDDLTHRAASPYPTMTVEQISRFGERVRAVAAMDAILWLWTTNAYLTEAHAVVADWGFRKVGVLTWVKPKLGLGDWLRNQTEHCLMGVRGKPVVTLSNESTVLYGKSGRHSEKPHEFYTLVEGLCPAPRYAEFFARKQRPSWDGHGNELSGVHQAAESQA